MQSTVPKIYHLKAQVGNAAMNTGGWTVPLAPDCHFENIPALTGSARLSDDRIAQIHKQFQFVLAMRAKRPLLAPCINIAQSISVVDHRLANLIETLEPGRHQLIQLENIVLDKDGPPKDPFYLLVVHDEVTTVDKARSALTEIPLPHLGDVVLHRLSTLIPEERVVYASAAKDRHLWCDALTFDTFCDETFKNAVEAVDKKSGINFAECTVI